MRIIVALAAFLLVGAIFALTLVSAANNGFGLLSILSLGIVVLMGVGIGGSIYSTTSDDLNDS